MVKENSFSRFSSANWPAGGKVCAIVLFLGGLFIGINLNFFGTLPVGEIIILFGFAWIQILRVGKDNRDQKSSGMRILRWLLICQCIATLSLIFADLWRGSYATDFLRGWMRMILLLVDIFALSILTSRFDRSIWWFQYGVVGSFISLAVTPPLFDDYWKFGIGSCVVTFVLLVAPKAKSRVVTILAVAGLVAVSFLMGSRGAGVILAVTTGLLCILALRRKVRFKVAVVTAVLGLIGAYLGANFILERRTGGGDRSNVERAAMQEAAWQGFLENPFVGQGSWFSRSDVMERFLDIRARRADEAGGGLGFDDSSSEGVAIHSHILVSIAEGGILGGTFFIVFTFVLARALWKRALTLEWSDYAAIELMTLVAALYQTFMNAFSGSERIFIAFAVALSVAIIGRPIERELPEKNRVRSSFVRGQLIDRSLATGRSL